MLDLRAKIYVSIPFDMLITSYLDAFIENRVNPEITFEFDSLDKYSDKDYEYVSKELSSHGLSVTIHAPYMDLCPGSPDPKVRDVVKLRFNQVLSIVPIFKAKTVVCHTGFDEKRYHTVREMWLENSLEIWKWMAEDLAKKGAKLVLENVFEKRPQDMISIINGLSSYNNVGLCFDPAHANVFSIVPLDRWAVSLLPFLEELHLHNNSGNWDEHRGLHLGVIDFDSFLKLIGKLKKNPPIITLETHNEEEFWPSLEYLKKIWPWKEE